MATEKVYIVTTPYKKVAYQSARDAVGVFETTSGEYKFTPFGMQTLKVPIQPDRIESAVRELKEKGRLTLIQRGFSIEKVEYLPSIGAI